VASLLASVVTAVEQVVANIFTGEALGSTDELLLLLAAMTLLLSHDIARLAGTIMADLLAEMLAAV